MADHLVAQKLRILLLQAQTVIFFILIPVLQLDDQVDGLGLFYALHTEQCLHIDDTDAPQLDEMSRDLRGRADELCLVDPADLHHIIGNQTVAPLDEFQRRLALTDTALTHDKDALAVYVHQHAVNGNTRRQLDAQPVDDLCHHGRGLLIGVKYRTAKLHGQLQEFRIRACQAAEDRTRNFIRKILPVDLDLTLQRHVLQIGILHISHHLHSFLIKMLKISCQLQCRSVNIRNGEPDLGQINVRRQVLKAHCLHKFR